MRNLHVKFLGSQEWDGAEFEANTGTMSGFYLHFLVAIIY